MSNIIQKWNKADPIFPHHLDPIYKTLDYCDVFYVPEKGYAILNHQPKYNLYKKLAIPEIQDVFVIPDHRKQGIATQLIHYCESTCDTNTIGISVPIKSYT